jgi:hypothetical protein
MRSWSIFSLWWTIRASRVPVTWPNPLLMILLAPDGYLGPGLMDFRVDSCTIASVKSFFTKAWPRGQFPSNSLATFRRKRSGCIART